MAVVSTPVALVVLLVLFQRVQGASLVTLEHSLDGINYKKAGSFQLDGKVTVAHVQGYSLSNILKTGVDTSHTLYFVRVVGNHANTLEYPVASIPLSCWMHAGSKAKVDLFTTEASSGTIQSVSLHAPCPANQVAVGRVGEPEEYALTCSISTPRVAAHVPLMTMQGGSGEALEYLDLTNQGQQSQEAQSSSTAQPTKKGGTAQAKDDRTWLQKNWMFVALGAFILLNKVGAASQDQQRSGPPARNVPVGGNARQ
ncbi:hypothetical protein M9435_004370 [Picochlorum sp. BPE23]|nr:hypothetical protein M9435_004370 [Picochlorum sp. BPE23]